MDSSAPSRPLHGKPPHHPLSLLWVRAKLGGLQGARCHPFAQPPPRLFQPERGQQSPGDADFIPHDAHSSPRARIAPEAGDGGSPVPQPTADRRARNLHLYSALRPPASKCFDLKKQKKNDNQTNTHHSRDEKPPVKSSAPLRSLAEPLCLCFPTHAHLPPAPGNA